MTLKEQIALLQGVEAGRMLQRWDDDTRKWLNVIPEQHGMIVFRPDGIYRLKPEPRKCWVVWEGKRPTGVTDDPMRFDPQYDVVPMQEVLP